MAFVSVSFRRMLYLSSVASAMVGPDARVDCEPGQVRKEAAISMPGPVPSVARPWLKRLTTDFNPIIVRHQPIDSNGAIFPVRKPNTNLLNNGIQ